MVLSQILRDMLFDNGFSTPEELMVYRSYDPTRKGCNLERRFFVFEGGPEYVHCEYEMMDLLMGMAYGPFGEYWRLINQSLLMGEEPSLDGNEMRPYYVDELTIMSPDGIEETFYFDVSAHMLSALKRRGRD